MKKSKLYLVGVFASLFYSCDKSVCEDYRFENATDHLVYIRSCCGEATDSKTSLSIGPKSSAILTSCGLGDAPFIYNGISRCVVDKVVIIFDDTLEFNTQEFWEFDLLNPLNYQRKNKENIYEINQQHYQKALEVNGYLR